MDSFSNEGLLIPNGDEGSPGSQLFLYRLLHLAAAGNAPDSGEGSLSYHGVRRLAGRLGIASGGQLISLFRDLGLGILNLDLTPQRIVASLKALSIPGAQTGPGTAGGCELERGLIDGALEMITGFPVTTVETRCRAQGGDCCSFQAIFDDSSGRPRFVPGQAEGMARFTPGGIPSGRLGGAGFGVNAGARGVNEGLRTWFMDLAARELARARRHGRQLTVMYVDLDDLGQINNAHGRAAGDQVIRAVGAALSRGCRSEDFLWHQGEDEFAIVLAETGSEGAGVVASRLSTEVLSAAEYIDVAARISASIGFSTFPVHAEDVDGLFTSARSAVYLAKSMGKGRAQAARRGNGRTGGAAGHDKDMRSPAEGSAGAAVGAGTQGGNDTGGIVSEGTVSGAASDTSQRTAPIASIVVASHSPLLRAGMTQVLSSEPGLEVMAEITDQGQLPLVAADLRPDLIFADLGMATENDFAVLKLLRDQNLPCKFVVFCPEIDQEVIKLVADFSIEGVILQEAAPLQLLAALKSVYEGKTVLPDEVQEAMRELSKNRQLLKELSEREVEVLRLVAEGKSNSQISNELFITVNTVRFHLANIYQKLSVSNRTEAANYYLRQDMAQEAQTRLL